MYREKRHRWLILVPVLFALTLGLTPVSSKKRKEKNQLPKGTPVLWHRPSDISSRDLFWGPGGKAMQPDLARVTFIEEEKGGYSKKYRVRDASGREWVAKIGKEAQSETAAVRLLWAAGYETEINYLVPRVEIMGKGTFTNVRFEARPQNVKRAVAWKWSKNPFVGTRELQGLKVLMVLLNNWDIKDSNNKVLVQRNGTGGELRYIISDLGATFGHASGTPIFWRFTRSRNNPVKYAKSNFVEGVKDNYVRFHYGGKRSGLFKDITVEDARWIGSWLALLNNQQLKDVFRAANYTPGQIDLLANTVRERTNELVHLPVNDRIGRRR